MLIGAGAVLGIAATGSTRNMPMEYRVVGGQGYGALQTEMNKFGGDNWEFVATSGIGEQGAYAIFRRPRQ